MGSENGQMKPGREAHMIAYNTGMMAKTYALELHEACDIIKHGDSYPTEVVERQHHIVGNIFAIGLRLHIQPQAIADACEAEYIRLLKNEVPDVSGKDI